MTRPIRTSLPPSLPGLFLSAILWPASASAQAPAPCDSVAGFHALDFWVGRWEVVAPDRQQRYGRNRIEKVLNGCAVTEAWTDDEGGTGMSLFFYNTRTAVWKQIWVTDNATRLGGLKEKTLIATLEDGSLRFQGTLQRDDGGVVLDRTTLTPLADGAVRQHIEISLDDGVTWRTTFDAHYLPQH